MVSTIFNNALYAFFALLPVLNPPSVTPIFLDMTSGLSDEDRHRMAWLISKYVFLFLFCILVFGGWVLRIFGISVPVVRVAGGLLLFNTAWRMLNNEPKFSVEEQVEMKKKSRLLPSNIAFFPLTMPITAGPGSIATTLSLVPTGSLKMATTWYEFIGFTIAIALASLCVLLSYRYSDIIYKRMGNTGALIISKLFAFILLALSINVIWEGIKGLIKTF